MAALLLAFTGGEAAAQSYDLVIAGGRVMDPESGLDAVRHLGIRGGTIAAISEAPLQGRRVIDAAGLVVAPGFIDLHAHGQDLENYRYYVLDGVTTALELEIGVADIDAFYAERAGGQPVHFGATIGHPLVRRDVMGDPGPWLPSGPAAERRGDEAELAEIRRRIDEGLAQGAVGVGFGISYTPAASFWEIQGLFGVAAAHGAGAFIHMRGLEQGLPEALAAAVTTGAPLHVVHINSTAGSRIRTALEMIDGARVRGVDVTTEAYPYTAGSSMIESALYDGWESWPDERFERYEWAPTGERLTRETFAKYRAQGGNVISHGNTEENVRAAITHPGVMVASDALLKDGKGHPRTTGTFAKVLGRYVREEGSLTLMDALAKMTILPARRLEGRVPAMADKGRIRVGADADLTLFDPATVIDRSTYQQPALPPAGIPWVLVAGVPVVANGALVEGAWPGRGVRAPVRAR
ncbi:MAG TPA: amidohydrolase family protein [Longimicrobiales bacterium]|nr:amidohydrolase family protein [Longimicrobiales bacterium]